MSLNLFLGLNKMYIYVLASSRESYLRFLREHGKSEHNYIYLHHTNQMIGLKKPIIVLAYHYWMNSRYNDKFFRCLQLTDPVISDINNIRYEIKNTEDDELTKLFTDPI